MTITQQYREEAEAIATEINDKYGISLSTGNSINDVNNRISEIVENMEDLLFEAEKIKHPYSKEITKEKLVNEHGDNLKADLEKFRKACSKLHGEIHDPSIKFSANNI